jgi:hypothetical protein
MTRGDPPTIRFHPPYERLARRKAFGEVLRRMLKEESLLRLDNFAIFDAVARRGYLREYAAASSRL